MKQGSEITAILDSAVNLEIELHNGSILTSNSYLQMVVLS